MASYSIRLVRSSDLSDLVALAHHVSFGLTTLSPDPERLQDRIEASHAGDAPLLVMVDESDKKIVGTAGIFTRVGDARRAEPFYAYRIERSVHQSKSLDVHHEIDTLHLVKMFNGPTELGTLFVHPEHRGGGKGRLLSLSRFHYMFQHPKMFDRQVITELRGVVDDQGHSPFWDALGRKFFRVEFPVADALSARDKRFIAELMPPHPIYIPFLAEEGQRVIGEVHQNTRPARQMLEGEGFYFSKMVDIFDGGPCLRCDSAAIRSIREAIVCAVAEICPQAIPATASNEPTSGEAAPLECLVSSVGEPFRLVGCVADRSPGGIRIDASAADRLGVKRGDSVCVSPLKGAASPFGRDRPILSEQIV
ncbi:arginine N-succinyltransferase [Roseiconus nitratireducens]|uniref:Arginine N-succinyltransferase n=1 Tax=Roseiconus nitratireducens TaxID=2605748 RepID=A0A5M6DI30_9BACT|nr:arginine N-succinyltransferase [Roseiconus nitratireducens]KAA5547204.1 arginine N-succinyltransferase [Roseiconus nitratireducens]